MAASIAFELRENAVGRAARIVVLSLIIATFPAHAISPEAREFIEIIKSLEPVHCEKRKLRREIVMAEVEKRSSDALELKKKFASLDGNPQTAKLEKRLTELERRISDGKGGTRDPEDLQAISFQQRRAFYACE